MWGFLWVTLMWGGCSYGPSSLLKPEKHEPDLIPQTLKAESDDLAQKQQVLRNTLQQKALPQIEIEPLMPSYDPLEDHIVSFAMVDEDIQMVLYSLSQAVGMNFIIEPNAIDEERTFTLNFENVSAATVLREILAAYDLYYEIDQNVIRIKPFQEKIFNLNFLDTNVETSFEVGGDVLGAGETETTTGLSGRFLLSGKGALTGNAYTVVEEMIKRVLTKGGQYSLNRLSGSLYIKDTPAVIRSVEKLINHFKETLARQILIEARIIEVYLKDEYQYGIDWNVVKELSGAATELTSAAWSLGSGLILTGTSGDFTLGATVDALNTFGDLKVVSNPSIRSKHGQPSIMSVGTSYTYKKRVTTKQTTTSSTNEETTDIEVSTVFDGLILGVIPFIEEDGRVSLLINPIKSDVDQTSLEAQPIGKGGESISLPIVSIRELSATIAMNNGDVVILGGLIDKRKTRLNKGVPFLSAIPVLGYLFKNEQEIEESRELVIILSVKLI
jgi:MSHA type pilus biogenesis protein MshL